LSKYNKYKISNSIYFFANQSNINYSSKFKTFLSNKNQFINNIGMQKIILFLKENNIKYIPKELPKQNGIKILKKLMEFKHIHTDRYSLLSIGNDLKEYSIDNEYQFIINRLKNILKNNNILYIAKHGKHIRCIITPKYDQTELKIIDRIKNLYQSYIDNYYCNNKDKKFLNDIQEKLISLYLNEYKHQKKLFLIQKISNINISDIIKFNFSNIPFNSDNSIHYFSEKDEEYLYSKTMVEMQDIFSTVLRKI